MGKPLLNLDKSGILTKTKPCNREKSCFFLNKPQNPMFLYRLVDLWRCLWQMTRKSITWPWNGCRLSLRRNLSPDQALVLYTDKNDVDWSRGSSCILFDMLSLHSSTAWKLIEIPWFFWKKSIYKIKARKCTKI